MRERLWLVLLRPLLATGLLLCLLMQVWLLPWLSGEMAHEFPEVAYLHWPVLVMAILGLMCLEVLLFGVWQLLAAVQESRIFRSASLRWVDLIVRALGAGTLLTAGLFGLVLVAGVGPVTVPVFALLAVLVSAGLLLLMLVMRSLLCRAADLRTEMDAVI